MGLKSDILRLLIPVVVIILIMNVVLLTNFNGFQPSTTLILQEVHNKLSDGTSKSGQVRKRNFAERGEDQTKISPDEERRKISGNGNSAPRRSADLEKEIREPMSDSAIDAMIKRLKGKGQSFTFPSYFWNISLEDLARRLGASARKSAKTLSGYKKIQNKTRLHNWRIVHRNIRQFSLYDPDSPALNGLIHDLATLPIDEIDDNPGGTQLKLTLMFTDGGRAVFKPMRFPREVGANPNHFIFDDIERHVAEIAAFHLDRLLGFYRVPPTIGRKVNLTSEIRPNVPKAIAKTFFTSPAGNICFYGECDYFCDSHYAFCGSPDVIEGSVMSYLPSRNIAPRFSWYQPWRRSYSKFRKADWEKDETFCRTARRQPPLNNGKMLMDIVDAHTFDFLTGNKDRHSFVTFTEFGNYSFPIMYDNGRGFGRQDYDAMSILAPLRQCCSIRKSTFLKYLKLYIGPDRLSSLMEKSLARDPVAPVLLPGHLNALDRRLVKILKTVAKCLENGLPSSRVIVPDRF